MIDTFGDALRALRTATGLTLNAFAKRVNFSKGYVGNVETGERPPTRDFAEACDNALGTTPLLSMLLDDAGGNNVNRRKLLGNIGLAASASAIAGPQILADLVRHGLLEAVSDGDDWDAVVSDCRRRFATDPSAELGSHLLLQLLVLRQRIDESGDNPDYFRAGASLGHMYGLLLGNEGKFSTAHNWYRTAAVLADRSKDTALRSFVRGRSLNRGLYEGYTAKQTLDGADEILSLAGRPNAGVLEAHAVRVCVHALTNNPREGRIAIADMQNTVDRLTDSESDVSLGSPLERTAFHNAYLESRVGSFDEAQEACEDALTVLASWPLWVAETKMYLARALVVAGDVNEGISYGLATARSMRHDAHVVGVAVRDVTTAVPQGHRSDELDALQGYASKVAGPWETLR